MPECDVSLLRGGFHAEVGPEVRCEFRTINESGHKLIEFLTNKQSGHTDT